MDLIDKIVLPKNWQELVAIKDIIPFCINKVTRFPKDNQKYDDYRDSTTREKHLQKIIDDIGDNDFKITPNKFPYSRIIKNIPEVRHYLLWSKNGELPTKTIESEIERVFPNCDYFYFVNPPNNKSIPEIWHCQIFVKLK
ncbi:MAG: hypothetical protein WCG91_00200 [Candidatus Shapirobacteria bacterium]